MTTGEPQPSTDTIGEKTLEAAQVVEKSIKPYEQLLLKCKDDWIHHLAQALGFSLLTALAPISILLLSIFSVILGSWMCRRSICLLAALKQSFRHHSQHKLY